MLRWRALGGGGGVNHLLADGADIAKRPRTCYLREVSLVANIDLARDGLALFEYARRARGGSGAPDPGATAAQREHKVLATL